MRGAWSLNGLFFLLIFTILGLSATIYAAELAALRRQASTIFSLSSTSSTPATISTSSTPTNTATSAPTSSSTGTASPDVLLMQGRMIDIIIGSIGSQSAKSIPAWLSTLQADGKWPDSEVDYTTGCPARRANWPAQDHWQRILVMTGAWHGGVVNGDQYVNDPTAQDAISRSMDYWFGRDITNIACLDNGGTASCSCDNPDNTLWNTNWYSNIILIPMLVGQVCLLLNNSLSTSQSAKCASMTQRSFDFFYHTPQPGFLSGANVLDIGKIGIENGLLTLNDTILHDAFFEVHNEMKIQNAVKSDGIRADGSFGQHAGVLYNGNYGKDYANDILDIELVSAGTTYAASTNSQKAFGTLYDADRWMVIQNVMTGVLHWDLSVIGRFISFPVADSQATGSLKMNLTKVQELGDQWSSDPLVQFAQTLSSNTTTANAGSLTGNRMFYTNDYMASAPSDTLEVHRGSNYVSTLKMYSSRTLGSECVNSQNPYGFHLSDGTLYTYVQGNEYEDISAAWDWNLIPGTTVDYGATKLACENATVSGIESFVGGASDGSVGIAAMRYTNPLTKSLSWQKTWFFLDEDVQQVMLSKLSSKTNATVFSVLDQRLHMGQVIVDGQEVQTPSTAHIHSSWWHGGIGYAFPTLGEAEASIQVESKSGNWSSIGTSTQLPVTVDLLAATIKHRKLSALSYAIFPGSTPDSFKQKSDQLRLTLVQNDATISAAFDEGHNTLFATFWSAAGGTTTFNPTGFAPITLTVNGNVVLIYKLKEGKITLADPSQSMKAIEVLLVAEGGASKPLGWGQDSAKTLTTQLPSGGSAGSSVTISI
ncbi:polysaccharide lyase family 8 protein [Crepidotus variabilis]|uniref:Polysaccharide lyase family 8 protein n=1 Tax=Crepidotus variabilis TaxID=179855 RepID=A0A9P6EMX6_9AGAR|nr:polysaccharide lyase family 8 protein [Crepidotus variabilis]